MRVYPAGARKRKNPRPGVPEISKAGLACLTEAIEMRTEQEQLLADLRARSSLTGQRDYGSSKRTMVTASRAIRDGAVDTWTASVEQLADGSR